MALEAAVAGIIAAWDGGVLGRGEVVAHIVGLFTATNVAEVVTAVPAPWRAELVDHLRAISADGPLVGISGDAAAHAHFEAVIRPAIRAWVHRQG